MLVHLLALVGFSFIGPVVGLFVPVLATEALAMFYAGELGIHPLWIGLAATIGQNLNYIVLYYSGAALVARWGRLHRAIDGVRARFANAQRNFLYTTIVSAFVGVPPMLPVTILARGFDMRLRTLLAIGIPLRFARYAVLAALGSTLWPWIVAGWHGVVSGWNWVFG